MANQINQKRAKHVPRKPFIREQQLRVKKIPWVLPIECGDDFPRIQIREGHHLHLGVTERGFHPFRYLPLFGGKYRSSNHRRHLDLDSNAVQSDYEFDGVLSA